MNHSEAELHMEDVEKQKQVGNEEEDIDEEISQMNGILIRKIVLQL